MSVEGAFLLAWLLIGVVVSVVPLPFAVVHARRRASDATSRTPPGNAWNRFVIHLRRWLRPWAVVCSLFVLFETVLYGLITQAGSDTSLNILLWYSTLVAAVFASVLLVALGCAMILSEYVRDVWTLLVLGLVLSVGGLLVILFGAEWLLRFGLSETWLQGTIEYTSLGGRARSTSQINYAPYYYLILAALFAFWSFRRARRRGDRWLRFQE